MDQLKLPEVRKPRLTGFLALAFVLGVCLGGTLIIGWIREPPFVKPGESTRFTTLVGVKEDGNIGILATLTVELKEGRGLVLISADRPYENEDTQRSALVAKRAAEYVMNRSLDRKDVIFVIEDNAERVAGESAGASMALTLLAAIRAVENVEPNEVRQNVIVSATIDEVGRLGPVDKLSVKIPAARDAGFEVFVVSDDQRNVPSVPGITIRRAGTLEELANLMLI